MIVHGVRIHRNTFLNGILDLIGQDHEFPPCFPDCLDLDECPVCLNPGMRQCYLDSDLFEMARLRIFQEPDGENDPYVGIFIDKFLEAGDPVLTARFVLNNLWYFEIPENSNDRKSVTSALQIDI